MMIVDDLIGIGTYSIAESSKLTKVSRYRISRWIRGYTFKGSHRTYKSPPVWQVKIKPIDDVYCLSFIDLMEVRIINAFLTIGVSWKTIRKAEDFGGKYFNTRHPFTTNRFRTTGRELIGLVIKNGSQDKALIEVSKEQKVFKEVIEPYFVDIDFDDDIPKRWWPLQGEKSVVIDPKRCFGKPIVSKESIPTEILAKAYKAEGSFSTVAKWFKVSDESVKVAVKFENQLAA